MKTLTLLLIPLLFLASCTIDWNDEKDKKIASLNTKIEELNRKLDEQKEEVKKTQDDEIFKKKKECSQYKSKIEEKNDKIMNDGLTIGALNTKSIKEIIYSKKYNTCYAIMHFEIRHSLNGEMNVSESNIILDILADNEEYFPIPQKNTEFNIKLLDIKD